MDNYFRQFKNKGRKTKSCAQHVLKNQLKIKVDMKMDKAFSLPDILLRMAGIMLNMYWLI